MSEHMKGQLFFANMLLHVELKGPWTRDLMDKAIRFPELLTDSERTRVMEETERRKGRFRRSAQALMSLQTMRKDDQE
jgi:hypothetical protein